MKQVMDMLLEMPANTPQDWQLLADLGLNLDELDEDTVNNILIVNAALLKNAKLGDVASIKELRSIIRDDDLLKHKIKIETARLELEKKKIELKLKELSQQKNEPSIAVEEPKLYKALGADEE